MTKIKKAIIPAAGLGTRFLPTTKAMPKEMLPIADKPTIQYIVEEAVASGIRDILIVTGKNKRAIEDHFDSAPELEQILRQKGKTELLNKVLETSNINIHYIRQKQPLGLGHAIWCARNFIGDEPFAVLLGDDIVQSEVPCLKQLMQEYSHHNCSIIGVQQVPEKEINRYGIVKKNHGTDRCYRVQRLIEKPALGTVDSNLAIMGRYILRPEIFTLLENQEIGAGGEIQLTDALEELTKIQAVYAYEFAGTRYDVGEKLGFIKTTIDFALQDPELGTEVFNYINEKIANNKLNKAKL